MSQFVISKASLGDVKEIHGMLLACAGKGLLLPRALNHLYRHVRDFSVARREDGKIVACCALAPVWDDLAEVCSLVVDEEYRGQGLGRKIVEASLEEARPLRLSKIFALTYQEKFFMRLGFSVVEKDVLPQKIWADCVHCPKYPDCDETAVLKQL